MVTGAVEPGEKEKKDFQVGVRHVTLLWACNGCAYHWRRTRHAVGRCRIFELQTAVERKAVMSRGADERTQMNSMAILLASCESTSNRERVDQVLAWTTQGTEQQQRERAAGVKHTSTVCWQRRHLDVVKLGVVERNGMTAFGRIRERFGQTAGAAKLTHFSSSGRLSATVWSTSGRSG